MVLLTLLALLVLVELEALEGGSTGNQLVGEFALVFLGSLVPATLFVDLLVGIFGFTYEARH